MTFADYLIPSAAEVPSIVTATMDIPTPIAPNGAKGIGENGAVAAPSSVQNAVLDALRPYGVTHLDLPLGGTVVSDNFETGTIAAEVERLRAAKHACADPDEREQCTGA